MVYIPEQLKNHRFIKVNPNTKKPIESQWTTTNNYSYDELSHLSLEKYGVLCGHNNLVVVDFDNEEAQNSIIHMFTETFTVKSAGRGLYHLYYYTDVPKTARILNQAGKTLVDIQGEGTQVIGPNSINKESGRVYEIVKDIPISTISRTDLLKLFESIHAVQKEAPEKQDQEQFFEEDQLIIDLKKQAKISHYLKHKNIPINTNPTMCPLGHESQNKQCFSFDDKLGVWHCFHCLQSGNIIQLVQRTENLTFIEAKQHLCKVYKIDMFSYYSFTDNDVELIRKEKNNYFIIQHFFKQQPFFYDELGYFWMWDNVLSTWNRCDETELLIKINNIYKLEGKTIRSTIYNELIKAMRQIGRENKPKTPSPFWIQFKNMIYDIKTQKQFPSTHEYFFTNQIPWELSTSDSTPTIDALFKQWVNTDKNVEMLYDIIAYASISYFPIHRLFVFVGNGRNGKGTFNNIVDKFIGESNRSTAELNMLVTNHFERIKLYKKLVCRISETDYDTIGSSQFLKSISGGDPISVTFKGKDAFDFKSYTKLFISTNEIPQTNDKTDGFFSRWFIVEFPNTFIDGKDILLTIPEIEYANLTRKVVNRLPRILEEGKLTGEVSLEEKKRQYARFGNSVESFLDEYFIRDVEGEHINREYYEPLPLVYHLYKKFSKVIKRRELSRLEFKRTLEEYCEIEKLRRKSELRTWVFGIKLKDKYKPKSSEDIEEELFK